MSSTKLNTTKELRLLEELFVDELTFKIYSVLSFQLIRRSKQKEILSFMNELKRLSEENIQLLAKSEKTV